MAEKVTGKETILNVNLRREWLETARHRRGKKAVAGLKEYLRKNMKAEDIKISQKLNDYIWSSGMKNPPAKARIKVLMEDGKATAQLPDEVEEKKAPEKKGRLSGIREKAQAMTGAGGKVQK
jgi:ribosomal protein L31E